MTQTVGPTGSSIRSSSYGCSSSQVHADLATSSARAPAPSVTPSWYLNLLHNPAVVLQVRSEIFAAIATPATASERPRLWRLMVNVVPK
jgi:hypothetical protein